MNVAVSEIFPVGEKVDLEDLESRFLGGTYTPFSADIETGSSEPPPEKKERGKTVTHIYLVNVNIYYMALSNFLLHPV